jgi:hypothetical protein
VFYDKIEDISTSGSDPTFDTINNVGDECEAIDSRTRAQKVHNSTSLASIFNKGPLMF